MPKQELLKSASAATGSETHLIVNDDAFVAAESGARNWAVVRAVCASPDPYSAILALVEKWRF